MEQALRVNHLTLRPPLELFKSANSYMQNIPGGNWSRACRVSVGSVTKACKNLGVRPILTRSCDLPHLESQITGNPTQVL